MTTPQFEQIITAQLKRCTDTLIIKAREYATDDRLHNFKNAAVLQGVTPIQALAGMMAKHTVSVYDMCAAGKTHPAAVWDEKIGDSINYLLLLRALVEEGVAPAYVQAAEYQPLPGLAHSIAEMRERLAELEKCDTQHPYTRGWERGQAALLRTLLGIPSGRGEEKNAVPPERPWNLCSDCLPSMIDGDDHGVVEVMHHSGVTGNFLWNHVDTDRFKAWRPLK